MHKFLDFLQEKVQLPLGVMLKYEFLIQMRNIYCNLKILIVDVIIDYLNEEK